MLFLKISNADMAFGEKILIWKSYTTNKALPTIKQVQLVDLKDFVIAVLDADSETFVEHMAIRKCEKMAMDSDRKAQIKAQSGAQCRAQSRAKVGALIFNKAPIKVPAEYSDYSDIFSVENEAKLPKNIGINEYAIKLEKGKQLLFGPIYSLGQVMLETLKTYIETNLANSFIRPSKSPAGAPILFNKKPDRSFRLCVDYRSLKNIINKNQYLFLFIDKSLDRLGWIRKFTQLDLTNAYY